MTLTLYIAFSTAVFILMYIVFRSRRGPSPQIGLENVNVKALANLMDPAEQQYLSQSLPAREYRRLHRKRMRVALAYLNELATALPSADRAPHSALSHTRLLILELRIRAISSYLLPSIKVKAARLDEAVADLVPLRG